MCHSQRNERKHTGYIPEHKLMTEWRWWGRRALTTTDIWCVWRLSLTNCEIQTHINNLSSSAGWEIKDQLTICACWKVKAELHLRHWRGRAVGEGLQVTLPVHLVPSPQSNLADRQWHAAAADRSSCDDHHVLQLCCHKHGNSFKGPVCLYHHLGSWLTSC